MKTERVRRPMQALLAACAIALASTGTAHAADYDVTLPLPSGVTPDGVALWGGTSLLVEHEVTVTSAAERPLAAVSMGGSGIATRVGRNSRLDDVYSKPPVTLDGAILAGDVRSEGAITQLRGTQVGGAVVPNTSLGLVQGARLEVTFPTSSSGPVVAKGGKGVTLAPGRYGAVEVRGRTTLTLRAGDYYFASLLTEPDATLFVNDQQGGARVFISGNVSLRGRVSISTGNASNLLMAAFGSSGSIDKSFVGTFVQPFGRLLVGVSPGGAFVGAFFAQSLSILQHSTMTHVPSRLLWEPRIPTGTFATTELCLAHLELSGDTIAYKTPPAGCEIRYCDENGQTVATPTEDELNTISNPDNRVVCEPLVGSSTDCPIDPNTVQPGDVCTTSADCDAGEVCGVLCKDAYCETVERLCGELAASCSGLSGGGLCAPTTYRECAAPDSFGTISLASVQGQLFTQTETQGGVDPSTKTTPRTTYPTLSSLHVCEAILPTEWGMEGLESESRHADQGSSDWGVTFDPIFEHHVDVTRRDFGESSPFDIGGNMGVTIIARVPGNPTIPVLQAGAAVSITRCGVRTTVTRKIFDFDVAFTVPPDGQNGLFPLTGNSAGTKPADTTLCQQRQEARKDPLDSARIGAMMARHVGKYVSQFGTSKELCEEAQRALGETLLNCTDPAIVGNLAIFNRFRELYDQAIVALRNAQNQLKQAQEAVVVHDELELTDQGERFNERIARLIFGIGPFNIFVDLDLVGEWGLSGKLEYSISYSGGTPTLVQNIGPLPPSDGDIRATAGPIGSARLLADLVAFAGAGIPDAAEIGIEGTVNLIDTSANFDAVGTLARVSEPDERTLTGSDWIGDFYPEFPKKNFRIVHGWRYGGHADVSVLDGKIDVVARVGKDPFELTYREMLTDWNGISDTFTLAGSGGGPLFGSDDFGAISDIFPLTTIGDVTPATLDYNQGYTDILYDPRKLQVARDRCDGFR